MHAEERQHNCSQRHQKCEQEDRRLSSLFRLRAYRTVQTRVVSSRSVHHGIFPDVYFYTQSLQRPHERRPMASRREQVSALFFVAWTQRRLTECFPWPTEGPSPPKETLMQSCDLAAGSFSSLSPGDSLHTRLSGTVCSLLVMSLQVPLTAYVLHYSRTESNFSKTNRTLGIDRVVGMNHLPSQMIQHLWSFGCRNTVTGVTRQHFRIFCQRSC